VQLPRAVTNARLSFTLQPSAHPRRLVILEWMIHAQETSTRSLHVYLYLHSQKLLTASKGHQQQGAWEHFGLEGV